MIKFDLKYLYYSNQYKQDVFYSSHTQADEAKTPKKC